MFSIPWMQRTPAALKVPKHLEVVGGEVALHSETLVALLGHITSSTPTGAVVPNPPIAVPPETQCFDNCTLMNSV